MGKSKSNIIDTETTVLEAQLATARLEFNAGEISFKNSKGEVRSLPYARVDKNGTFVGDRQTEMAAWDDYVAACFRAQHEQKRAVNGGNARLSVKAGHSLKMGTASCAFRTSKMVSKQADVTVQFAHAQKLARQIDAIQGELDRRAEAERLKAAEHAQAQDEAGVLEALMGTAKAA